MSFFRWIIQKLIKFGRSMDGLGWCFFWVFFMFNIAMFELFTDTYILLPLYIGLTGIYMIQNYIRKLYAQYRKETSYVA